jgi:hypothetical protein
MPPEEYEQNKVGRCDFLDVLEEAATVGGKIHVRLTDGRELDDTVREVVTEGGRELVVFGENGTIPLASIAAATRGPSLRGVPGGR